MGIARFRAARPFIPNLFEMKKVSAKM